MSKGARRAVLRMEGRNEPTPSRVEAGGGEGPEAGPDLRAADVALDRSLDWARRLLYAWASRGDAVESGVLRALLGWSRPSRLLAGELVLRSPVNLRPLLGVPRRRSPLGIALFAQAYLFRHQALGDPADRSEASALLEVLCADGSPSHGGLAWGYHHRFQDAGFYAPARLPNRVVPCFV